MHEDAPETIGETIRGAVRGLAVPFGILYGSTADGRVTPVSDVDVALYAEDRTTFLEAVTRLEAAIPGRRVDVVNLRGRPAYFYYNVLARGRLLWCHDEALLADERYRVMREYLDFKPVHDRLMEDMRRRLENGTYGRPTAAPEGSRGKSARATSVSDDGSD